MTYSRGAKITPTIVDEIANGLIATPTGYWIDADITWNTTIKTGNSARRALKYDDGIEIIYLALEVINQTNGVQYYYGNQGWWYYGKGIRVIFSAGWDSVGHTYSGTTQSSFIGFETHNGAMGLDMATTLITYFLWHESNGFVIMGKPEPSGEINQQSFLIAVERNPNKRYVDGYSTFYCYTVGNVWADLYDGNWVNTMWRQRFVLRPFAYQYPNHTSWSGYAFSSLNGGGISFSPMPSYYAYKSAGNGKVYYVKPIIHNQSNSITPIFQSELFFLWSEGLGLIDGDIVAIQGQPTKFLCKALDSPDSTNRLTYAIKYVG